MGENKKSEKCLARENIFGLKVQRGFELTFLNLKAGTLYPDYIMAISTI